MGKKLHIKTYGCQMNVYDSTRLAEHLAADGWQAVGTMEAADMIILNSCHIREKAAEKIYSELGRLKPLKEKNPRLIIGVAGCVAQAEGAEMLARAPLLDMVFGPQVFDKVPRMVTDVLAARAKRERARPVRVELSTAEKFTHLQKTPRRPIVRETSAFITVQEGCDKFCTFCVVPYTRGGEISRPARDIVAEAKVLASQGVCEITLLGQNVNAWADPQSGDRLDVLLARLAKIEGLARLRFTTSHPRDMDARLIAAYGENDKLMAHLHLPVQAGSDRILAAMNRKHSAADYIDIVRGLRATRPDVALSSDFIVGFPGETEEDFQQTLDLVEEVGFAQSFSFKYSPRPGTPAAEAAQIDESVKIARLARLQELLNAQQAAFNKAQIGRRLPVLFDGRSKQSGQVSGRSAYLQPVHVRGDHAEKFIGRVLPVDITAAHANSLSGEVELAG